MALTPEDVVNKRFQQTKFREGYDQDEVDDFLDEIVVELRRLLGENEELKRSLDQAAQGQPAGTGAGAGAEAQQGDDSQLAERAAELDRREAALDAREEELTRRTQESAAQGGGQPSSIDQLAGVQDVHARE